MDTGLKALTLRVFGWERSATGSGSVPVLKARRLKLEKRQLRKKKKKSRHMAKENHFP